MSDAWHFKKETLQNKSEDAPGCAHPHQANSEVTQFIIQKKKKKKGMVHKPKEYIWYWITNLNLAEIILIWNIFL